MSMVPLLAFYYKLLANPEWCIVCSVLPLYYYVANWLSRLSFPCMYKSRLPHVMSLDSSLLRDPPPTCMVRAWVSEALYSTLYDVVPLPLYHTHFTRFKPNLVLSFVLYVTSYPRDFPLNCISPKPRPAALASLR